MRPMPLLPALLVALLAAGCGGGSPPEPVPARPIEDPGYVSSASYSLYYAANATTALQREALAALGIEPAPQRILLNLAVRPRQPGATQPVGEFRLDVAVRSVPGQPVAVELQRRPADAGAGFVATFDARHREPYAIEVTARTPEGETLVARFTREFWVE